ncbi:MAG: hypothetical protein JRC91_09565 [Deltaproteobacteria bacterium]|nr:hypothetical protein [Deltaproteobacteria bacterium]
MIRKKVLAPARVRKTGKSFCFISHRFLTDGFLQALTRHELALYVFLVLASDRNGLSFYSDKTICSILAFKDDEYIFSRSCLIHKNLIMYDGTLFQVLSLPKSVHHKEAAQ